MLVNYTYSCPPNQARRAEEKKLTLYSLAHPNFGKGKVKTQRGEEAEGAGTELGKEERKNTAEQHRTDGGRRRRRRPR